MKTRKAIPAIAWAVCLRAECGSTVQRLKDTESDQKLVTRHSLLKIIEPLSGLQILVSKAGYWTDILMQIHIIGELR
jgi:hypothetical protein